MSEADLIMPEGYIKQVLGERPTKYIKGSIMRKWVNERKKDFGSRWNFVTDNDKHVLALKRELTDVGRYPNHRICLQRLTKMIEKDEIKAIRNLSYPPKQGSDLFEE